MKIKQFALWLLVCLVLACGYMLSAWNALPDDIHYAMPWDGIKVICALNGYDTAYEDGSCGH